MKRALALLYCFVVYALFMGTVVYLVGFVGNLFVPKSIDKGFGEPASLGWALLINISLVALFALQHTSMARQGFKQWLTRMIPEAIERSTFILFTVVSLVLICLFWQPMPTVIYKVEQPVAAAILLGLSLLGWMTLVVSTFLIDHFEFAGLKQALHYLRGTKIPELSFKTPGLYRIVRHPMLVGVLMGIWFTPVMTVGHLVFSLAFTAYIAMGVQFEERDLVRSFGKQYEDYKKKTPMFLPLPLGSAKAEQQSDTAGK